MTTAAKFDENAEGRPIILEPTLNLKRRQVVAVERLVGPLFTPDWSETAKISGKPHCVSQTSGFWWPVTFADGGSLCIHETQLRAV